MRLKKELKSLGWTLDDQYTKNELKNEILYIKGKLVLIGIFCLITLPLAPLYCLFIIWASIVSEKSFFNDLMEDIQILINPPRTCEGSSIIFDSKGNVVRNVSRYYSNPNGNYRG